MLVRRPCCSAQQFHRGTDRLNRDEAQPSISKPKTLGTHLLSFPDKWVGREHLQGVTLGEGVISRTKIKQTGLQLLLGN